ncbi:MAG: aminoglycoside phosphotransferase family protein, partial [Candidatus Adiutrix sp.]
DAKPALFKYGPAAKMKKEHDNLAIWAQLCPELVPEIQAFVPSENLTEASVVLEYIPGPTLRDLFINGVNEKAIGQLSLALKLIGQFWLKTRTEEKAWAGFARQAEKRLGSLKTLHPQIINFSGKINNLTIPSISQLLAVAKDFEETLSAPFSVRIHGDFNLSNIICKEGEGINFIDLYRSRPSDYAQDLSVMTLSILRLPWGTPTKRDHLFSAAELVWDFALKFAHENKDDTIMARLAFGLARSFLTSARFDSQSGSAALFINYSRYLWGKIIAHGQSERPWSQFTLDKQILHL